jgi:putative transposase
VNAVEKSEILALVVDSGLPRRRAVAQLRLSKSTYYRWLRRQVEGRLQDRKGGALTPWNKLMPEEESRILTKARASPELSARQLALSLVDSDGLYVSESTVFRILKREGLIKPAEIVGFKAGKEYHRKTKRPNELWATDCAYLKVVNWGWYYLVTVMDDFSRFILAWELKSDMAAGSLIDLVQQAVDLTGMTDVPVEDRTVLLSDNGPGYLSRQFNDYLRLLEIRHIIASPYHPQTNGKIERYHRTIKGEINLMPYEMPGELKEAIKSFIDYYNYRRYHEGLGDVTPYDVYTGRYLEVIQKRKEAKNRTLQLRRDYNRTAREQGSGRLSVHSFTRPNCPTFADYIQFLMGYVGFSI